MCHHAWLISLFLEEVVLNPTGLRAQTTWSTMEPPSSALSAHCSTFTYTPNWAVLGLTLSLWPISRELERNSGQRYDFVLKELKQCKVRFLFAPFHGGEARAPGARGLVNWGLSKPGLSREVGWRWPKLLKPLTQHKAPLWGNSISGCASCYGNKIHTSPKLCAR